MAAKSTRSYQQLSAELAEILAWFEGDAVELDQAIIKYESALKLIDQLETELKTAKNKVKKINATHSP